MNRTNKKMNLSQKTIPYSSDCLLYPDEQRSWYLNQAVFLEEEAPAFIF